jgi:hypothetical protein
MNIPENILSNLTEEQKKRLKKQKSRKNSSPWQKKQAMNYLLTHWKQQTADGVLSAKNIIATR